LSEEPKDLRLETGDPARFRSSIWTSRLFAIRQKALMDSPSSEFQMFIGFISGAAGAFIAARDFAEKTKRE
jgi:hypothetical protein